MEKKPKVTSEILPIKKLKPAAYNPRDIDDDAMAGLKASVERFGMVEPIVWNKRSGNVVGGHQRLKVLQDQGVKETQVQVVDLSATEEKALNLTLNNYKIEGHFNDDALALLDELEMDFDGFEDMGLDFLRDELHKAFPDSNVNEGGEGGDNGEPEDPMPDISVDPITSLGELWTLGNHRLLCGDATNEEDVARLIDGVKADMVFTDPPYDGKLGQAGFANDPAMRKQAKKLRANIKELYGFDPEKTLGMISDFCKDPISYFFFCNKNLIPRYLDWGIEKGFIFDVLAWHKTVFIPMNNNKYFPDTDYIIKLKGKGATFNSGIPKEKVRYNKFWVYDMPKEQVDHPTMKPIHIINDCLLICSNKDDVVLDLFGGSGSTMIACERADRKCNMMEILPGYVDVILQRWVNQTDQDPVREDGTLWSELNQEEKV